MSGNKRPETMVRITGMTQADASIEEQVAAVQDWINNYPRKILDWKTALEAAV